MICVPTGMHEQVGTSLTHSLFSAVSMVTLVKRYILLQSLCFQEIGYQGEKNDKTNVDRPVD